MAEVKKEVPKSRNAVVKEFHVSVEGLSLATMLAVVFGVGVLLGGNPVALFVGCAFLVFAYVQTKRGGYGYLKKEVVDQLDQALKAREAKFAKDGKRVLFNNFVINEIYCDIQGPRQEGVFVVVCQMNEQSGKEFLYVYRHESVDGRNIAAEDLIAMEEEALGAFTTLLMDQGHDATQIMGSIEYRVKDKIESRKASRGAKDKDDHGGAESS